jgi:hypothetical protein
MNTQQTRFARNIEFRLDDIKEALPDFLASRAHMALNDDVHPVAADMVSDGITLADIANRLSGGERGASGVELFRALTTSDFSASLETALAHVVAVDYRRQSAEHAQLVRTIRTPNMKPIDVIDVDMGELEATPAAGGPQRMPVVEITTGASIAPTRFSARFLVSRQLLVNDDVQAVMTAVGQLSAHASRLEASALASVIASNPTMPDGAPFVTTANTTTNTGFDLTSLGEGLALMRTQTTSANNVSNTRPAFLLVPPQLLATALVLVASMTAGNEPPLRVAVNAWLASSSDAFLLADPAAVPAFIRTQPRFFAEGPDLVRTAAIVHTETGEEQHYDGVAFTFSHAFGIGAGSRLGFVKIAGS